MCARLCAQVYVCVCVCVCVCARARVRACVRVSKRKEVSGLACIKSANVAN